MEYLVVDTELRFALAYYCSSELTFPRNLATSIFSVLLLMNISILELSWGGGLGLSLQFTPFPCVQVPHHHLTH